MEETNPYDAPQAELQVPAQAGPKPTLKQMLFSMQGRIRRKDYWLYTLGFTFGWMLAMGILMGVAGGIGMDSEGSETALGGAMVLGYIPVMWVTFCLQAKRWHDREKSAKWVLLNLVPLLNLWAAIELGFLEGTHGPNRYGPDPKA